MKKQTFTLVELLVVVGIIALLAGLIIPAVGMAQTSARRTACLSNQGQVMKIMRAYMNEGDVQFLPNWHNSSTKTYYWTQALFNAGKLQNDISVARCPAILPFQDPKVTDEEDPSLAEAYGMIYSTRADSEDNRGIKFKSTKALKYDGDTSNKSDDFMVAANQLALGGCSAYLDSGRDQIVAKALLNFNQDGNGTDDKVGRPTLAHGGQVNIFFLDGHSESLTKDALYRKKYYTRVEGADDRDAVAVAHSVTSDNWILDPDAD